MTNERSAPERGWCSPEHWQHFGARPSDAAMPHCAEYVRSDISAAALNAEREKHDREIETLGRGLFHALAASASALAERDTARAGAERTGSMLSIAAEDLQRAAILLRHYGHSGDADMINVCALRASRAALNPQPKEGAEG